MIILIYKCVKLPEPKQKEADQKVLKNATHWKNWWLLLWIIISAWINYYSRLEIKKTSIKARKMVFWDWLLTDWSGYSNFIGKKETAAIVSSLSLNSNE